MIAITNGFNNTGGDKGGSDRSICSSVLRKNKSHSVLYIHDVN